MASGNTEEIHKIIGGSGTGNFANTKGTDTDGMVRDGRHDSLAQSPGGVMVLDGQDLPSGSLCLGHQSLAVDWLNGEGINDTGMDS